MAKTLVSQGNIRKIVIRQSSALTTDYIASNLFNVQGANQLQLLVSFTLGASTGCRLKIEFSEDEINWYQESAYDLTDYVYAKHKALYREIESSCNIVISVPISATFFRISSAALTSGSGTSLSIIATISNI